MEDIHTKPKLVFFQYKYDENLPEFLLMHKRDHVKCLAEFFDVTVIHDECDYQQICDKYQPEITLFEAGVNHPTCQRPDVTNTRACPEIPKLALHNADAWCNARAGFLSDMERLGIETFFAICTTAAEHAPEISENLYIWPNFIDSTMYRDYGRAKIIPILLTGNTWSHLYPWRQRIYRLVSENYPSLICPHRGYGARAAPGQIMYGEQYARTINASLFVPTCGTVAKEVVRKHFEIPGCQACLITEKSQGLEAAGFADMENCIFADGPDVLEKLDYLFRNTEALERITNAGFQLAHSRHTSRQRGQIWQWWNLQKNLKSDQKIVQCNPFEPLTVVEKSSGIKNSHVISNGLHLTLLAQGDEKLGAGKYAEAEGLYLRCSNYMRWMPEPKLRLALCNLYKGDAKKALSWILAPIDYILGEYKAIDPDPVEWAYFIVCLLCLGKLDDASKRAGQFPWLHHLELDRIRWVSNCLKGQRNPQPSARNDKLKWRCSVHQMPMQSFDDWVGQLCIMLMECRQCNLAERLRKYVSEEVQVFPEGRGNWDANKEVLAEQEGNSHHNLLGKSPFFRERENTGNIYTQRIKYSKFRSKVQSYIAHCLHGLEAKYGYFLPYNLSESRNDEFFHAIQVLTREEDIESALVIGATGGEGSTEAFLAGIKENENKPLVFCVNVATRRFVKLQRTFANDSVVKCYRISAACAEQFSKELGKALGRIREENQIKHFDAVLIDTSELSQEILFEDELKKQLYGVSFVLLDDINSFCNYENHSRFLRDPNYVLAAQNPGLRNGYAIFKRSPTDNVAGSRGEIVPVVAEQDSHYEVNKGTGTASSEFYALDL